MMINVQYRKILIFVVVVTILIVFFNYVYKQFLSDMLLRKLVPFIQKFEGGLSRDPNDTASRFPAPWSYNGKTGWHTNKGITYNTFKNSASRLGYAPTAKNFFEMPDDIWMKILKGGYMSTYPLDDINHLPRIQAVIITWAWGSGVSGSEVRLARFQREEMGIVDSNITREEIVANFKKKISPVNERMWFNKLCDRREADFRKMGTFPVHGRGWLKRLAEFRKLFN